ncbi:B12-binding domain-containing protein [Nocardioides sp.]|uniref:B12-binding domain-containing protein n=1 Tax=Nocardioides sp. TaxID=35761 RepID=UPI003783D8A1
MTVAATERDAYWSAVLAGDAHAAYAVAADCVSRGVLLPAVLDGLVTGSQARVGDLWSTNAFTVAQEHAATAVSEAVVTRLAPLVVEPSGPLVLVACAEREWHSLPALVVTHTLRAAGVRAEFLGASASREQVVTRILDTGPRLVLLSASVASSLPRVRRQVEAIRGTGTPVVVGGRAFGADALRAQRLGATAYAATPADVVRMLDTLPRHVPPAAPLRTPAALEARSISASGDEVARDVLADPAVAAALGSRPGSPDHWTTVLATFVPHVVDCVVGALLVDDPAVVAQERVWLEEVVVHRGGEVAAVESLWTALTDRLREYPEAVRVLS